jgi:hypothetical protein
VGLGVGCSGRARRGSRRAVRADISARNTGVSPLRYAPVEMTRVWGDAGKKQIPFGNDRKKCKGKSNFKGKGKGKGKGKL